MDLRLNGKKAVVLAASGGLGRGIAGVLSAEGCEVAICGRNEEKLQKTADEIFKQTGQNIFRHKADVADAESLSSFFKSVKDEFGNIDILINNAGGPPPGSSEGFSDSDYMSAFELSLMSVVRSVRHVLPNMKLQSYGRIITLTSTSVKCVLNNMVLSNTFRSAAAAFTKSISMEIAGDGIRAHTILTGPFLTDRVTELGAIAAVKKGVSFDDWKETAERNTPLKRFGDPVEMGNLVAFLCSELSSYMNGTSIAVDGGILTTVS